jgi:hypothetical protein
LRASSCLTIGDCFSAAAAVTPHTAATWQHTHRSGGSRAS